MEGIFPQSRELRHAIEREGWSLYDVSNSEGHDDKWDELSRAGPAEQYEIGHIYQFFPIPKEGQTLRDAYASVQGSGPSLKIDNPEDDRWAYSQVREKRNGCVAVFSCLGFEPSFAVAVFPDLVAIKYEKLLDTFETCFETIRPEDYGIYVHVLMPYDPERN